MGFLIPLYIAGVIFSGSVLTYGIVQSIKANTYEMKEFDEANTLLKKAKKLEELNNIETRFSKKINKNNLSSIKSMKHKPFSVLVSNVDDLKSQDINNYAEAIKIVMDEYPNAADSFFTCSKLEETGKISQEACEQVQSKNLTVYKMNKGALEYGATSSIALKANSVLDNREFNVEKTITADGNNSITTKTLVSSNPSFKKEMQRVVQLENKAEEYLKNGRYLVASQVLSDVDEANVQSPRVAELRVRIVKKQLEHDSAIVYNSTSGVNVFNIEEQDFSKVNMDLKESIIKSIGNTGKTGIKSYSNNLASKYLLQTIQGELMTSSSSFTGLTESQKEKFLSIMNNI